MGNHATVEAIINFKLGDKISSENVPEDIAWDEAYVIGQTGDFVILCLRDDGIWYRELYYVEELTLADSYLYWVEDLL